MKMDIIINNASNQPLYEQIVTQIKQLIISNILKEGEALPSMRLLAKELKISVITTKRAYEELEREGLIEPVTGKGSFVSAKNPELLKEESYRIIEQYLNKVVEKAKLCGLSKQEILELLDTLYE